jgi:hypothetical protein
MNQERLSSLPQVSELTRKNYNKSLELLEFSSAFQSKYKKQKASELRWLYEKAF